MEIADATVRVSGRPGAEALARRVLVPCAGAADADAAARFEGAGRDRADRFPKGADGLAALAQEVLKQDPLSGVALVFRAKRADRIKILVWDGSGLVLYWNYLRSYCISFSLIREP